MKQPQEIEVWYILPAIRRELAKALLSLGLNQKKVAEMLDVTEPAISQYLKSKRAKDVKFSDKIKKRIKEASKIVYNNKNNLVKEMQDICELIKKEKLICDVHRKYDKLEKNCCVCFKPIKKTKNSKIKVQEKNYKECRLCGSFHKVALKNCPKCGYIHESLS